MSDGGINFDQYLRSPGAGNGSAQDTVQREDLGRRNIFGEDIRANSVPSYTTQSPAEPYAAFQDRKGSCFALDAARLSKHLLLLGGIGSGKTNVFQFLLESLMARQRLGDVIFIFDTKGDFFQNFYQSYNPNHIVIGHGARYAQISRCWNLFGELETPGGAFTPQGELAAKEIASQLFVGRGSDAQPFFALAAADLMAKLLIDFERQAQKTGDRSQLNNQALADWLRSANLEHYMGMIRRNPDFASAQLYFGDPGQGTQQRLTPQALGVFGYLNAMCNDLFTGIFAQSRPGYEFSMNALVRDRGQGRTVVFIEYDLSVGEVLSPIYRLLIDLALKEALGQNARKAGNVFLFIDEFKLLPELIHIDDALNFGRSLGVKVFAGLQSISQIYAGYGEDRGKAILSGFMNCFAFHTPDYSSRQYISERFGESCYHLTYRALDQPISFQREGRVLEDWDILNLQVGEAAVDLVGERPFLFRFSDYETPHPIL